MSSRHLTRLALTLVLFTALTGIRDVSAQPARALNLPLRNLTIQIRDFDTATPMTARVGVFDGNNIEYAPANRPAHVFQDLNKKSYFYVEDQITLPVWEGTVRIEAGHGFEYTTNSDTILVTSDTTIVMTLERVVDMEALGWYSGDTHVHITHQPVFYSLDATHLRLIARGEDLNFVNSMEQSGMFTGMPDPLSDPNHVLYFSKEQRNADFSHLSILGLKSWIPDQGCGITPFACGKTLNAAIYQQVHAQGPGVAVIATHPFPTFDLADLTPWPGGGVWRGMPLDLVSGTVDAMDVVGYTHAGPPEGVEHYFQALNAGFKLPPSAGTDSGMASAASRPPGGYRVYVEPTGGALTMDDWIEGFVSGRSFVTNYPLITDFSLEGSQAGDVLTHSGGTLTGSISIDCIEPIDSVRIVGDTGVLATLDPPAPALHYSTSFQIDPTGINWVVAIVKGRVTSSWHLHPGKDLYAQSAPIYLEEAAAQRRTAVHPHPHAVSPESVTCQESAIFFINMLTEVDSIFDAAGLFPDSSEAAFDSAVAQSFDYFHALCLDPPEPFDLVYPLQPGETIVVVDPSPTFVWRQAHDFDPNDSVAVYELLIAHDDFANPVFTTQTPETTFTLPPATIPHGVDSKWRVEAIDQTGRTRVSTPDEADFVLDPTATGIGPVRGFAWRLEAPHPNPFNPSVEIVYHVADEGIVHRLEVYDARGRRVRSLYRGRRTVGAHRAIWRGVSDTGAPMASGVYFVRLQPEGGSVFTRKVILLK